MVGFSKNVATKADLYNLLGLYPEQTKSWLQDQLTAKERWITIRQLEPEEEYTEDDTHRIASIENEEGVVIQRYAEEYMVDPNWYCYRIGLTDGEINTILGE